MSWPPLFERLEIETHSSCNRSCWFCPRTYDRSGKYRDQAGKPVNHAMSTERVLDILDQAQALGFRGLVAFSYYSEPLLEERSVWLARESRERGMKPFLLTNGDALLQDDALCEAVLDIFEYIVMGLYDYETVRELEQTRTFWRSRLAGADLRFSPIGLSGAASGYSICSPRALVPSDARMAIPDLTYAHAPCHRPPIRMIIQHDGTMANCCEDIHGAFGLGTVHEKRLAELWFSTSRVRVVDDLAAGRREAYELCRDCPMPPTGPSVGGRRIDMARRRCASVTGATVSPDSSL